MKGFICTGGSPTTPDICDPICGDGLVFKDVLDNGTIIGEICDDGNKTDGNGCSPDCLGVNSKWICSTGNSTSPSLCIPKCGDGFVVDSEFCDDGDTDEGSKCNQNCTAEVSGWYCSNGSPS